ncbi:ABC transporter substrate-binding protein [Paucibacter soli]|uniref:ABC transporter substrate-binding protein n=1 Tax=Paucibacter soli TaxID=3133433 RepID=UPI0030A01723
MNRHWVAALLLALTWVTAQAAETPPTKVLRYAFPIAETGFDPSQLTDIYSRTVTSHIFESLYRYDHLARPVRILPLVAAGDPEVSADFKTFTVRITPGIYFADDPVFKGQRRELTAADFVFTYKRFADPALKSPIWSSLEEAGLLGMKALRQQALASKQAMRYDTELEGLRALDRYTLQFRTEQPRPRLVDLIMNDNGLYGALAPEVVAAYGDKIAEHPVGTGPFRLKSWRRSSQIVLEKNPGYRERYYDAEPVADDAEGEALLARFKGRRIPMLDEVQIAIIEEVQPRWLSFLNTESDFLERVPAEFIGIAAPGGKVAPNLAKRGVQAWRTVAPDATLTVFNMEHPVVGGMGPDKVALRRAISLATDVEREIRLARRAQAIPAQSQLVPHTKGYEAGFKSELSSHDPARAKALLDLYGYLDRDGDGWRELPDGQPLVIQRRTQPDAVSRQLDELWQKNLMAVGIKLELQTAKWPENLKSARAGKFMVWGVASSAASTDGQEAMQRLYGPASGGQNLSRFNDPRFNQLYERMKGLPDGPERAALLREAQRISLAYLPYKAHVHRIYTDLAYPWLIGYRRPLFWQDWWQYVDVDEAKRPQK